MFHFFFFLLAILARISNTLLSTSGDGGNCCLDPDFNRNACSVSPLNMTEVPGFYRYLVSIDTIYQVKIIPFHS